MNHQTLIADLWAHVPVGPHAREDVVARMSGADRHYHGIDHLAVLWGRHIQHGANLPVCQPPWHRLIASTIAFHDAIYEPVRQDNEIRSAKLWRDASPNLDLWEIAWVSSTILATADHLGSRPEAGMTDAAWAARLWLLDLDLTPLGEAEDDFNASTGALRREYAHLDDATWASGRRGFLKSLSLKPVFYRTPVLAAAFEHQARENLARELADCASVIRSGEK